jgi:hypothetical protein
MQSRKGETWRASHQCDAACAGQLCDSHCGSTTRGVYHQPDGAPARTISPFAGALVAIDILLDNTFIVACASPSAIIDISAVYSSFSDARARAPDRSE